MRDLTKLDAVEFGKVLAKECPHLSFDPEGEPLAGNDPFDTTVKRVWGRLFISSGWYPLALRIARRIEAEIRKVPEADRKFYFIGQIKEKYAGMKFYTMTPCGPSKPDPKYDWEGREADPGWNREVCKAIKKIAEEADQESYGICEDCGKPGRPRRYGWERTHCDECYDPKEEAEGEEAWEGCIVIEENRVHGAFGSVELLDDDG